MMADNNANDREQAKDNSTKDETESKGPSKKELKKLAKKAEKANAKNQRTVTADGQQQQQQQFHQQAPADVVMATVSVGDTSTETTGAVTSRSMVYQLIHVPVDGITDLCTLKACMASVHYGVPLFPSGSSGGIADNAGFDNELSFLHGPALRYCLANTNGSGSDASSASPSLLAFGGNGIIKALALVANSHNTTDNDNGEGGGTTHTNLSASMDDWLEYERCELRPALMKGDSKLIQNAIGKIEIALREHGGTSVVGGSGIAGMGAGASVSTASANTLESFTAADLAITITLLLQQQKEKINNGGDDDDVSFLSSPAIQAYMDITKHSSTYARAKQLAKSLSPPPAFDPSDPSLLNASSSIFNAAILSVFPMATTVLGLEIKAFKCKDIKHGDYQCNIAMPLYQKLKAAGIPLPVGIHSPPQVAQLIIDAILSMNEETNPVLCDLSVNGPGFIMSRIKASYLSRCVNAIVRSNAPTPPKKCVPTDDNIVVVDFSSPNIAKEMHVGHLRSTIIGEAVCRILEYTGATVMRINHVGDWGTQFGMLIQYLKEEYPDFHASGGSCDEDGSKSSTMPNITDLTLFYKNAKSRFDESPEFKKISQLNVVKLQAGDPECHRIWQVLCDISRKEFEKVYNRLDITVEECGESFYNDKIPPVIEEFEEKGMISVEEGGAKCVFVPKFKVPLMLQKSDGGYGYDSTDMAAIKYRLHTLRASHLVYITDFTQGDHFQMVFAAAKKIGWVDDVSHRLDHIGFGTVQGEDGKRFKTRSGDTVRLVDLLDEAVSRMESSLKERIVEGRANISEEEVHVTASAMGYGAVKYFDLRRNPTSNYIFSYDRMLDTKGNTAIYLLYAHARLESIITKGKVDFGIDVEALIQHGKAQIVLLHKSERNLGLHLQCFADAIEETLKDLFPYHICDFLYDLSIAASEFVTQCKVLGSPEMESRLLLCRATAITMRQCFDLLGIRHVMRI